MKKLINNVFGLAKSDTAKDTAILFSGNGLTAFLGFLFTIVIARVLSVSDFGVFSAVSNLIIILTSLSDLGLSSGIVSFASTFFNKNEDEKAYEYAKAAFNIKLVVSIVLSLGITVFAGYVSKNWLANDNKETSYWVAIISLLFIGGTFLPFILQAKKLFFKSVLIDVSVSLFKAIIPFIFFSLGILTLRTTLLAYGLSVLISLIVGLFFTGTKFLSAKPDKKVYKDLVNFSGWLGVNRIISAISGKLDIQMLAAMAGSVVTGIYSIPSRLASLIIVLSSSFTNVLAPRFSSFNSKEDEKRYLFKSSLVTLGIIVLMIIWILIAEPFITILFGQKYLSAVPIFQALCVGLIPYMSAVPSVTAIIYAMKKTVYIGMFSFFQIAAIFILNYVLIPKYGPFGPTITLGVVNLILAIYSWVIVISYYSKK